MMAAADKIEEIKSVCWICEKKAVMNMRCKDGEPVFEGEQIQIGGNESYMPVCRKCYSLKKRSKSNICECPVGAGPRVVSKVSLS